MSHLPSRFSRAVRAVGLVAVWPATVALFALYGWQTDEPYFGYKHDGPFYRDLRFEPAVGFGAIGVGAASCIFLGLLLIQAVRRGRFTRPWASLLLVPSAIVGIVIPPLIVLAIMNATKYRGGDYEAAVHLFAGENGWWLIIALSNSFWVDLLITILLFLSIFSVPKIVTPSTSPAPTCPPSWPQHD
jgi:hypothetical protein